MWKNIRVRFAQPVLVFLMMGLVGCTTAHTRLYEGSPRGHADIALLKIQWSLVEPSARIETIDGTPVEKGRAFAKNIQEAELLPGAHALEVSYFYGSTKSIDNSKMTATFKAGGIYELHVAPVDEGFRGALAVGAGGKGHWTAWIIDAGTKVVLAGQPRTTSLRWYE